MKIITEIYDKCWEIRFLDKFFLGIVIEDTHASCVYIDSGDKIQTVVMPDTFFDMIKDEYKIKRPEIKLPKMEEVWELPF